jgi:hypothetical protein
MCGRGREEAAPKRTDSGMVESKVVSHFSLEKEAFIYSFRICKKAYHDLLREKPSSLFVLLGWSSISIASLMMCSMHPDFMLILIS